MKRPWVGDHGPGTTGKRNFSKAGEGRGGEGAAGASHLFRDQDILRLKKQMYRSSD